MCMLTICCILAGESKSRKTERMECSGDLEGGVCQTTKGSGYPTREPVLSSHHNKALTAVRRHSIEGIFAGRNSPGDDKLIKR